MCEIKIILHCVFLQIVLKRNIHRYQNHSTTNVRLDADIRKSN